MNIGFDAKRFFNNKTGLGNYSRAIVNDLLSAAPAVRATLYTPNIGLANIEKQYKDHPKVYIQKPTSKSSFLWRTYGIPTYFEKDNINVYHGLSHELPRNIAKSKVGKIVTIHDLIFKVYPDFFPLTDRIIYDWKCKHACKEADKIIAVSAHTKSDIIKYYGTSPDKIEVIYPPCDRVYYEQPAFVDHNLYSRLKLPKEYNLSVGSIEPRKNYDTLIDAYALIPASQRIPLVIVGRGNPKYVNYINRKIESKQLDKTVQIRSDIDHSDIVSLYRNAEIFIYPSHYEGYGLPITEALLSRTAVIASGTSSMQEAGGPNTRYITPTNKEDITEAILEIQLNNQLKNSMITTGIDYVYKTLNRTQMTENLLSVYRSLM